MRILSHPIAWMVVASVLALAAIKPATAGSSAAAPSGDLASLLDLHARAMGGRAALESVR